MVANLILLLNAGHEATVHSIGNGAKALMEHGSAHHFTTPDKIEGTVAEILRFDPPLHLFTRYVYEDIEIFGVPFKRGDEIACLLGAANRDPDNWAAPARFDPSRPIQGHHAFGAGIHFCVGAPLARLELQIALRVLFECCPNLRLVEAPQYANLYHFHGLSSLMVALS